MKNTQGKAAVCAVVVASVLATGCGQTRTNTDPLSGGESDAQVHARAVIFEQTYMKMHHVGLETAQCVQGATDAVASPVKMEAALHVNPHRTPVGDCTK